MKKALFSLLTLISISAFSQEAVDSYELFLERRKETLDANFVSGEWQSLDSAGGTIRFEYSEKGLYLIAGQTYYFYLKDSLAGFSPLGTIARWPPEDCYVKPLDENTIEVEFYNFSRHPGPSQFRRVKKK